jgi:hypothetical protein
MKSALYPADRYSWLAIALTAAAIAVLPPMPRLWAVGLLCALPLLAWMVSSSIAWLGLFLGAALLLPPLPVSFGNSGAHPAWRLCRIDLRAPVDRCEVAGNLRGFSSYYGDGSVGSHGTDLFGA